MQKRLQGAYRPVTEASSAPGPGVNSESNHSFSIDLLELC